MRYTCAPWWLRALTGAAESLLAEAEQHALTHAAVGRQVKVLHPPNMLPIPLCHLWVKGRGKDIKQDFIKEKHC